MLYNGKTYCQKAPLIITWQYVLLKSLNPLYHLDHLQKVLLHRTLIKQKGFLYEIFHCNNINKFGGILFLHAVRGNPPSRATGRVGAVGHIHLTWIIVTFDHQYHMREDQWWLEQLQYSEIYTYIWKGEIFQ